MASVDLGGQNEYAYDTTNPNLWGVFEIKFFDIWSGFCVKSVQTDRQTLFRFIYIDENCTKTQIFGVFQTTTFLANLQG